MKRIYLLSFIILTSLLSCEKELNRTPLDRPSKETFYSTETDITMAVNACYRYVASRIQWPWVPTDFSSDMVTDIQATRNGGSNFAVFKRGELSSTHNLPLLIWRHHYEGINRANALLDNMHRAEATSNPAKFKRIKSEARVLRAINYINLIQKFGDVPLVTKFIDVEGALEFSRTPKSEVLQFIYKELEEAAPDLPNKYTSANDKGRITKGTAYAMKARVALYNKDWAIARKAAKDCMDLNVYKLYPSYRDLFTLKGSNNDEIILDDQFMEVKKVSNWHQFNAPNSSRGQSQSFPTEDMIASFECTDGKQIDESPLYDPTNPFQNRDPRIYGAVVLPRVWDGVTIKTKGTVFNGLEYMSSKEKLYAADKTTLLPSSLSVKEKMVLDQNTGKMVTNQEVSSAFSSFTGYVIYKYIEETFVPTPNAQYTNFILCRYPEVLLTYAEASVELGTIDQSVLDAINMVRARAYGNTTAGGTDIAATNYPKITTTDPAELRKIVRRERKVELCFEGFRYEDLKRWGLLVKALNKRTNNGRPENYTKLSSSDIPVIDEDGLVIFPYAAEKYGPNNEQRKLRYFEVFGVISEKYNLYPIPLSEIQLNPKLVQNPGYN